MIHSSNNFLRLLSFTKQLTALVNQAQYHQALALFYHIHSSLALPLDPFVFPLVLKSCASLHRPQLGTSVHSHVIKAGFLSNPFVTCGLVDMYGKCASILNARKVFDEATQRNVVVWNSMISLYTHCNCVSDALDLFYAMDVEPNAATFNAMIAGLAEAENGAFMAFQFYRQMADMGMKPNLITLLALLPASVRLPSLSLIKEIHGYSIRGGIDPHPQLRSGLVEAYGRCGCISNASNVFKEMKERDVVAWSSLISAYAIHGEAKIALEIFRQMELQKVLPDDITFLAVLKACSHAGLADEALFHFNRMHKEYGLKANSDHYSCLIDVLSRAGRLDEAYKVIREMPVKATARAWGALLGACRTYGELELAEVAARALFEIEPENPANFVLLARIYASVGRHEEAQRLRREMKEREVKMSAGSSWVV